MRPIQELLKNRESSTWSLKPTETVFDALKQMSDHDVGAMMVIDGGKLVGMFSERDYTRKIALAGRSSKETLVSEIMTSKLLVVQAQTRTKDCLALMSQNKIRHLPVMQDGKVLGLISIRDIMDDIIHDHELTISQLQNYIAS